jgi:hypothetical protein
LFWRKDGDGCTYDRHPTDQGDDDPPIEHPDLIRQHQRYTAGEAKKAGQIQQPRAANIGR